MKNNTSELLPGATAIVNNAAVVQPGERVAIITDEKSESIAWYFYNAALKVTENSYLVNIPLACGHGQEPPLGDIEKISKADVALACTTFSLSHTQLRVNFCKRGGRFLSLADYDFNMLQGGGTIADYAALAPMVYHMANIFETAETVQFTTNAGTNIIFSAKGRNAMAAPAYCPKPGDFGSPPDIEANFAPIEDLTNGILVVDGSIPVPEIGLIKTPVTIEVSKGRAIKIIGGKEADCLKKIWDSYKNDTVRVAAELGIGLNPSAKLCGQMLEDEGVLGTAHVGFGANTTIGGKNIAPIHIDLVCRNATILVDGKVIMVDGKIERSIKKSLINCD